MVTNRIFLRTAVCLCLYFLIGEARQPVSVMLADSGKIYFGWGLSNFAATQDWITDSYTQGADWKYHYMYLVTLDDGTEWFLNFKADKAEETGSIFVVTFYRMLAIATDGGCTGTEAERVKCCIQNPAMMYEYFEDWKKTLMYLKDKSEQWPIIIQSEPDSWGFMMWAFGIEGNDDPSSIPAAVDSSGHPDAQGFPNNAIGIAQTLAAIRNTYAPEIYIGWHASNFRVSLYPEVVTSFFRACAGSTNTEWDFIFSEHQDFEVPDGWWFPLDTTNTTVRNAFTWLETVHQAANAPIILWQDIIGTMDYKFIGTWPDDQWQLRKLADAGVVAVLFDVWDDPAVTDATRAREGDWPAPPAAYAEADGTAGGMKQRVIDYYTRPLEILLTDHTVPVVPRTTERMTVTMRNKGNTHVLLRCGGAEKALYTCTIYLPNGKLVFSSELPPEGVVLPQSLFRPGIYLCRIMAGTTIVTESATLFLK